VVAAPTLTPDTGVPLKMRARDLEVRYSGKTAIKGVTIDVHAKQVLALIGPSGCGKSTFLRSLNRMNDTVPDVSVVGHRGARRRAHLRP
jgi:phosphate transport system ATP-binding protein